jgi:methionine aminopeptidase
MESTKDDHHSSCDDEEGEEDEAKYDDFVADSSIVDKYKAAAAITQEALKFVITKCVEGADIASICIEGDNYIEKLCEPVYSGKKSKAIEKGISFPTCININEVCGHYSPLKEDSKKLVKGNLVKIDLGCHIDGLLRRVSYSFIANVDRAWCVHFRTAP